MQDNQPKIGHYILGKTLGHGGFGRVKEATHEFTGTKVAIKIINKKKMKTKKMSSKVLQSIVQTKRQIRFLRYFSHPNIIRLYEVLDNFTDIFVVMELAPKGELFGLIYDNGKMSEELGRTYFRQILSGIDYCHQNLVAHRDLKPENILVGENDVLKIVDFGLSNLMKDGKFLSTSCGSLNYASPEIIGGKVYQGTLVDVWSCGIVLFAMLAGYLPFEEEHDIQLYRKIESGSYVIPNSLSFEAKDLINRMLQVNPAKRITVNEIKNHPWIREKVPLYAHVPSAYTVQQDPPFRPNKEAITTVMNYKLDFHQHTTEQSIIKAIKKKEDLSFVIAYQLLIEEQEKRRGRMHSPEKQRMKIFNEVQNRLQKQEEFKAIWQYGRTFRTTARDLARRVIDVLSSMNTAYLIKCNANDSNIASDYKIKCTYIPRRLTSANSFMSVDNDAEEGTLEDKLNEDKQFETVLPKYTRKEIIFTVNIYEVKPNEHLLDLQLNRGHSFIFIEYVDVFLDKVTATFG